MLDLKDDISELSSLSSYPRSPGASSQILPDCPVNRFQTVLDDDDDENSVLLSQSPSLIPLPNALPKRKQLLSRSWVWEKPEEPLGVLVVIRGIKYV